MDGSRFDQLARRVAGGRTRRGFLGGLAALAAGAVGLRAAEAKCPPGSVAASGGRCLCKATGRQPGPTGCPCPTGQTACGGVLNCKNLSSDVANCGVCGNVCPTGAVCLAGVCRCTSDGQCPSGQWCGGTAQTPGLCQNDFLYGGGPCNRDTQCATGICNTGTGLCACNGNEDCSIGLSCCSGVCLNLQTDPDNCGACGTVCSQPASGTCQGERICVAGGCTFTPLSAGAVCRPADGPCDQAESCDGIVLDCPPDAPAPANTPCGGTGVCAGACAGTSKTCVFPGGGTVCGDPSCTGGVGTLAAVCDGTGACAPPATEPCSPGLCAGTACSLTCASDADCDPAGYCDTNASTCRMDLAKGSACTRTEQCASPLVCADGVCCDTACTGQCEACNLTGKLGTCSAVTGAPVSGHPACAGTGPCAGTCNGTNRATCTYPGATTKCRDATCSTEGGIGQVIGAKGCDGAGGCTASYQDNVTSPCHRLFCEGSTLRDITVEDRTACSSNPYGECLSGSCCLDTFVTEIGQHFCCAPERLCPQGGAPGTASQCCFSDEVCFDITGSGGYSCTDPELVCGGAYCDRECCNGVCCDAGKTCVSNVCTAPKSTTCTPDTVAADCGAGFACVGWTKRTNKTTLQFDYFGGTCCSTWSNCSSGQPPIPTTDETYVYAPSGTFCCSTGNNLKCMGPGVCDTYPYWLECHASFPTCSPRGAFRRA